MKHSTCTLQSLFSSLDDLLNQQHPSYKLSQKIEKKNQDAFTRLFCQNNGRPSKPVHLMCGRFILKHLRKISDESVVEQ